MTRSNVISNHPHVDMFYLFINTSGYLTNYNDKIS